MPGFNAALRQYKYLKLKDFIEKEKWGAAAMAGTRQIMTIFVTLNVKSNTGEETVDHDLIIFLSDAVAALGVNGSFWNYMESIALWMLVKLRPFQETF